jgi:Uma2 family endonuclease
MKAKPSPKVAQRDGTTFTYGDYLTWPDDERWEIIDGQAFDMSPSPTLEHQEMLGEMATQLRTFLRGKTCRVFPDTDVILPKAGQAPERSKTVVRPDISVVCDPKKLEGKHILGAPDLAIEILSPSTASHDCIRKRRVLEKAGVREFWLIQPVDRIVTVFQRGPDGTFDRPAYYGDRDDIEVSVLPGCSIHLALVFPKLPKVVRSRPSVYKHASEGPF